VTDISVMNRRGFVFCERRVRLPAFATQALPRFFTSKGPATITSLALGIVTQVAAGLSAVQEQNLVHRDVKPSNIMVRLKDDGGITAKIIDLGLAKAIT
jgi:serine/threonine protein kinase